MAHPVAGAAAAGFLLASAWGAAAPFDVGEGGGVVCAPAPLGGTVLVGGPVLPPGMTGVLQGVRLLDASGLQVVRAWVVPTAEGVMGASEVPPVDFPPWTARVPAEGAVLDGAGEHQVLLEVVRTAGGAGSAQGVVVSRSARGHAYATSSEFRYSVRDACS